MKNKISIENIVYIKPNLVYVPRKIKKYFAVDTETFQDGTPILICSSEGDVWYPTQLPKCFFTRKYRGSHIFLYNLRFDAGVLLRWLPEKELEELVKYGYTRHDGYEVEYIPHKFFLIRRGKNTVKFWDLLQYFQCSLDKAAKRWLNDKKVEISTKNFTYEYVDKHFDEIKEYCIKDAVLTKKLADVLMTYLNKYDLKLSRFYSSAYFGVEYLKKKRAAKDIYALWRHCPELIQFALRSYRGGKFEMVRRGRGYFYQYDIRSAYPNELRKLCDIQYAKVIRSKKYIEDAEYGFLKVIIDMQDVIYHSVAMLKNTLSYYPVGFFETYITKQEYDYLISKNVDVKILDGWWIRLVKKVYLFKDVVDELYEIKQEYKHKDPMLSHLAKIMLNGLYGKMIQLTEDVIGEYRAGTMFNPMYASVVTANVRIRVSEIQNKYKDDIVAVHTDSVIATKNILDSECSEKLGSWSKENEGDGVMIMCGIYQVGKKVATRCYDIDKNKTWIEYLKEAGDSEKIQILERRAVSWTEAIHYRRNNICEFTDVKKVLNVNMDKKRVWLERTNCAKLLNGLETSLPHMSLI